MEDENKNILYRPSFGPDNQYDSDARFLKQQLENPNEALLDEEQREPSDIIQDFKQIKELLPDDVNFLGHAIIDKLIDRLNNRFPKGNHPKPDDPIYEIPKEVPTVDTNHIPVIEGHKDIPSLF